MQIRENFYFVKLCFNKKMKAQVDLYLIHPPIKEKTEILVVAGKEIGLEVNADKTKYMVRS